MFFLGSQLKQAKRLIRLGELNSACRLARDSRLTQTASGRRFAHRLIDQLVNRAGRSAICGELEAAWKDLGDAASIAFDKQSDRVALEKNRLVDNTVQQAMDLLIAGKPGNALSTVSLLRKRNILDRRADEVFKICDLIRRADTLAEAGRINDATSMLQEAKHMRPDLPFIDSKIRNYGYQKSQLNELTKQLRFRINESAWQSAKELTEKMLQIAPRNQIAKDAQQRCDDRLPKTSPQEDMSGTVMFINEPELADKNNNEFPEAEVVDSVSDDDLETCVDKVNNMANANLGGLEQNEKSQAEASDKGMMRSFMLWVDGVGGYLVCTRPEITIGRATPDSEIDVPLQADLRRAHFQIKRAGNGYLGKSLSEPASEPDADDWQLLKPRQELSFTDGVHAKFVTPNPLGQSARLEITSRHRTEPWSDAILLLGDAILMGPDRSHHVVCTQWKQTLVVFRRGDEIVLRIPANNELELSGSTASLDVDSNGFSEVVLRDGLRVSADDFSITCEQVS